MSTNTESFLLDAGEKTYTYQLRAVRVGTNQVSGWYYCHFTTDPVPVPTPPDYDGGVVEAWPFYHLNAIFVFWTRVNRADLKFYRVYRSTEEGADSLPIPPQKGDQDYIIAETSALFHIDVGWDKFGIATAGSTGQTLKDSTLPFLPNMKGERLWKIVDFETEYLVCNTDPTYNFGSIVSVQSSSSITTANKFWKLTGSTWEKVPGTVSWASGDKYRIDYHPWRGTQYYYWVSVVTNSDVESALSEPDGAKLGAPNDPVFVASTWGQAKTGTTGDYLYDGNRTFDSSFVGVGIYNVSAKSSGVITEIVNPHKVKAALTGGNYQFWGVGDWYVCGGTEDISKNVWMLKGWRITWTCDDGAEAYWISYRTWNEVEALCGWWTLPTYIPHVGSPEEPQSASFTLVVDTLYQFKVIAINNLIDKKCWSNEVTAVQRVVDTTPPDTITQIQVYSDILGNTIYWDSPQATDVAYYEIYKSETTIAPSRATAISPYWPGGLKGSYFDPGTGIGDEKRWYYRIASVDFHGNRSALSEPEREGDFSKDRILWEIPFIFGIFLFWNSDSRDKFYKIYRSENQSLGVNFTPTPENCIWGWDKKWTAPNFCDFGQCANTTFIPPILFPWNWVEFLLGTKKYYYKVEAYDKNSNMCGSSPTGIEAKPYALNVGTQTTGFLGADRVEGSWGILSDKITEITSEMVTLSAVSDALPGMISSITITPQAITLASATGSINIVAGQHINMGGDIKFYVGGVTNARLINYSSTIGDVTCAGISIRPEGSSKALAFGDQGHYWQGITAHTGSFSLNCTGAVAIKSGADGIKMTLPNESGTRSERHLYYDKSGYVKCW